MPMTTRYLATLALVTLGGLSLGGCVTTDYVDEQIAGVNQRIDALEASLQQSTSANAAQAQAAAGEAQNANRRIDQLTARVDRLEQQATAQRRPRN